MQKAPLGQIPVGARGELVAMDFMGGGDTLPITKSGNKNILVIIDVFTKYVVAVATKDQTAKTLADIFEREWLFKFGAPHRLLTDQGSNFESALLENLCRLWKVEKVHTTPYHPAGNGVCERANQTVRRGLQRYLADKDHELWDLYLPKIIFAYNTAIHSGTGFSPQRLTVGEEA